MASTYLCHIDKKTIDLYALFVSIRQILSVLYSSSLMPIIYYKEDRMTTDINQLLPFVVDVARDAGALLCGAFLQPGGPSGNGHHAEADDTAEHLIRNRLRAATPEWAYRGEETGFVAPVHWPPSDQPAYIWLVDPNDGTSAYLEGARGSAISITLLRDGIPVLGVIYAFAAPDNDGDLLAWAEGGPLLRNDQPVTREPWPTSFSPEAIVLMTHRADRNSTGSIALASPGRYVAMPSIAYRLALAAAGDGDVAISTNAPCAWDYAAGDAIMRGAGGTLVDQNGSVVTYTRDGLSGTSVCVGGAPALATRFAKQLQSTHSHRSSATTTPYSLCWPDRGQAAANSAQLARAQGCLLGQLAGDALGSIVEFDRAAMIEQAYPAGLREIGPSPVWGTLAGQPTDDSELALMLARTLVLAGFDEEQIAASYGYWYDSHPFDIGTTTRQAMRGITAAQRMGTSLAAGGRLAASRTSESNGALMRQSPLAIWGHALPANVLDGYVRLDTTLTHPNRVCQDASTALIVALAAVIREGLDGPAAYEQALAWNQEHGASATVTQALKDAYTRPPHFDRSTGHVLIALQNAFYQALHAGSFEEGVVSTVMAGGDTDTNAAIAGTLLGAMYGARALPHQWKQALLTCRPSEANAEAHRPRPIAFWPVDSFQLAERLLIRGAGYAASHKTSANVS